MNHVRLEDFATSPEEKARARRHQMFLHLDTCEEVGKDKVWEALLEAFFGPCPDTTEVVDEVEAETMTTDWVESFAFDEENIECAAYTLLQVLKELLDYSAEAKPPSLASVLARFEAGELGSNNPNLLDGCYFGEEE